MMRPIHVAIGARFGRLVVIAASEPRGKKRTFLCRCDCATEKTITVDALTRVGQQSCGCLRNEKSGARGREFRRHGEAVNLTREYVAWQSMIRRCTNVNGPKWHLYGGRGIRVCDRWRNSYDAFLADVGRRPGKGYSLDRIDNEGHYEPGNVRWADIYTQNKNRRRRAA